MPRNNFDSRDDYLAARSSGARVLWTLPAKAGNVFTPNINWLDADGIRIGEVSMVQVYLSSLATGVAIASAAPSSGWVVGATGKLVASLVTNLYGIFQTDVNGSLDIAVTQLTGTTFYMCVVLPNGAITIQALAF